MENYKYGPLFLRSVPSKVSLINLDQKFALKRLHKRAVSLPTTTATVIMKAQPLYTHWKKLKAKDGKRGSLLLMASDKSVDSLKKHDSLWKKIVNLIFIAASVCVHFCVCNSAPMPKDPCNREREQNVFCSLLDTFWHGEVYWFYCLSTPKRNGGKKA